MLNKTHNPAKAHSNEPLMVFGLTLDHTNVPKPLAALNAQLAAHSQPDAITGDANERDDSDIDKFIEVVNERAILVKKLLTQAQQEKSTTASPEASFESIDIRAFAEAEYAINNALESVIGDLKNKVVKDIASLNKNRKAIGKYTGQNVKLHQRTSASR